MGIIETIYPDGSPVAKADVRADDREGHRRSIASVSDVQNTDLSGQFGGIYVRELQANFDLDTSDTTTPDDSTTVLVDVEGNRFKIVTGSTIGSVDLPNDGRITFAPEDEDRGPFVISVSDAGGGADPHMYGGYNVRTPGAQLINPDDRGLIWGIEADYDDGSGHNKMELYLQYQHTSGLGIGTYTRSLMTQHDKVTGLPTVLILSGGPPNGIVFDWNDGSGSTEQQTSVGKQKMQMVGDRVTIYNVPDVLNPILNIDSSFPGAENGLEISSRTQVNGVHISTLSPADDEYLYIDSKGAAAMLLNSTYGGPVLFPNSGVLFANETGLGLTRLGLGSLGALVGSLPKVTITATSFSIPTVPGGSNQAFQIDSSAASAVTGYELQSAAAGNGAHFVATSTATHEASFFDAKGSGQIAFNSNSSGHGAALFPAGTLAAPGMAFTLDANTGVRNPGADIIAIVAGANEGIRVDGSTASSATGVSVKTAAAGSRVAVAALSSGTNEGIDFDAKGTGTIRLGNTSTGDIVLGRKLTGKNAALSYALTGDGLVMTNTTDMTGTGNVDWSLKEQGTGASTWYFAGFKSAAGADNEFLFRGDGTALCDGSWTGGGADYAEYFEWADGNPDEEDRRGISVVLTAGGKIRPATDADNPSVIIGVVSGRPVVVGDAAAMRWKGKYLRDAYGTEIEEDATMLAWSITQLNAVQKRYYADSVPDDESVPGDAVHSTEDVIFVSWEAETDEGIIQKRFLKTEIPVGEVPPDDAVETLEPRAVVSWTEYVGGETVHCRHFTDQVPEGMTVPEDADQTTQKRRILNPDYDPAVPYTPRSDRKEWAAIGLMGKLALRKGQPARETWLKMKDIDADVELLLVR